MGSRSGLLRALGAAEVRSSGPGERGHFVCSFPRPQAGVQPAPAPRDGAVSQSSTVFCAGSQNPGDLSLGVPPAPGQSPHHPFYCCFRSWVPEPHTCPPVTPAPVQQLHTLPSSAALQKHQGVPVIWRPVRLSSQQLLLPSHCSLCWGGHTAPNTLLCSPRY